MRFFKEYIKWFVIINSGVLLIFALNTMQFEEIKHIYLFEIFATSAVTALPTALLFVIEPKKVIPKYVSILMVLLHYVCLLAIMIVLGNIFGWIPCSGKGVAVMALSVAGVYICTMILSIILDSREAQKLNEALKNFGEKDNE